ncbi:thermonuclease family protein [Pseudomonas sp. R5(2019)]|nr:thermonuclease family protein [Pseudomonas sp. R5(2019)]
MKKASLAGAFFVGAVWLAPAQAYCPMPDNLQQVQVRQVVDGDTLRLQDGRSVRLIGVNAPEIGRKGRTTEPFAEAARQRLQALVDASNGRIGLMPGAEAKDHYGRTLAHAFGSNGDNFESRLLADGLGYLVAVAPNVDLVNCQQQAEQSARQAGVGLWRNPQVMEAGQVKQSGFALISGRVSDIQRNRGGIWIELDGSLVLRVAPQLSGKFADLPLDRLKGQRVEARGWIVDRSKRGGSKNGQVRWMLPLTDPAMLVQR